MQTFLPVPDFTESAQMLDYRRLGKQRVEAKQVYLALTEPEYGWRNHPAVKQWVGYEGLVAAYGLAMCNEWVRRGYNDTLTPWFAERVAPSVTPFWLGMDLFHSSHRSNLLRKDPAFYGAYGWSDDPEAPYWWPSVLG
jgi:hypothetical protein